MIQLFKLKSLKGTKKNSKIETSNLNERTREETTQLKKECGRSMVEMLGVLAIIGVLSIGGIQGYTLAMRKYQVNEILNAVNKYSGIIYTNCQNAMLNSDEYYQETDPRQEISNANKISYITINDAKSYSKQDIKSIWVCPDQPSFQNSGLGALPTGLTEIETNVAVSLPLIASTPQHDIVFLTLKFSTHELCKSVMATTGHNQFNSWANDFGNGSYDELGNCTRRGDPIGNSLILMITQN